MSSLKNIDPEVFQIIEGENLRQRNNVMLIPSENYASKEVLETQATLLNNKYAEGYPKRRYYQGCEFVDMAEELAIERSKKLFGAEHSNVQAHSGSQANMAAYAALLEPGDTIMGMRLDSGGHLTHGSPVNFSSQTYNFVAYGVSQELETLDYDEIERLAKEHRPKLIVAGYTAYPRVINFQRFRQIADEVGAWFLADIAHIAGLVATGQHPSPIPYAHIVTSTTQKTLRGPRGGLILCEESLSKKVDRAVFPYTQGGPFMHVIAAKAVCFREASKPEFVEYQKNVLSNARALAKGLSTNGLLHLVSGGTDNHLMLADLRGLAISGRDGAKALHRAGIVVNKNTIPYDTQSPMVTSGIRLGTPAVTSRGFRNKDMEKIAELILKTLTSKGNNTVEKQVKEEVENITSKFPVPGLDN